MSAPARSGSMREAFLAEMFGDLDVLVSRIEALPALLAEAEDRMAGRALELREATGQIAAVTEALVAGARKDLTALLQRQAHEAAGAASERASSAIAVTLRQGMEQLVQQQAEAHAARQRSALRRERWVAVLLCAGASALSTLLCLWRLTRTGGLG